MLYSYKKYLLLFMTTFCLITAEKTIKEKHILSYTQQSLDYWFYPNHQHTQLSYLASHIAKSIKQSSQSDTSWDWNSFSFETKYPLDYVEQSIRAGVLEFVKETSYSVARRITSSAQAQKISEQLHNKILAIIAQATILDRGVFSSYVGTELAQKVEAAVHGQSNSYTSTTTVYPSDACCVCTDDFSDFTRVFLKPCGHDICISCAEQWFFNQRKSSCPICRATVDKKALRDTINNLVTACAQRPRY